MDKADSPGNKQYCAVCNMWLNGPTQWEDHIIGKKHVKNTRRAQQGGGNPAKQGGGNPVTMTQHQHTAGDGNQSKTVKGKYKRRKKNGQAFSDSGYPYDAGMGESRPAYLEIGPLQ